MIGKQEEIIEMVTQNDLKWTPILLAANAGSLEAIKVLIDFGANLAYHDENGYTLIHVAAHR